MSTREAAALVRHALSGDHRMRDEEHLRLLNRAREDADFLAQVEDVADGLGLAVVGGVDAHGLLLSPRAESPFAPTLDDYPLQARTAQLRLCHGLIHVAIAAMAYPQAEDLEPRDQAVRLTVHDVDAFLWDLADRWAADGEDGDAPVDQPSLKPAWAAWRRERRAGTTGDGRAHQNATRRWVEVAFEWLERHGLAHRRGNEGGGTYTLDHWHRRLVREVTAQRLVDLLAKVDIPETVSTTPPADDEEA